MYQRPGEVNLGCSTRERPSAQYIEAFKEKFTAEGDAAPLKPVARGGGECGGEGECGDGECVEGRCICGSNVGPRCLANDMEYPPGTYFDVDDEELVVQGVYVPYPLAVGLGVLVLAFVVKCVRGAWERRGGEVRYTYVKVGEVEGPGIGGGTDEDRYVRGTTNRV